MKKLKARKQKQEVEIVGYQYEEFDQYLLDIEDIDERIYVAESNRIAVQEKIESLEKELAKIEETIQDLINRRNKR